MACCPCGGTPCICDFCGACGPCNTGLSWALVLTGFTGTGCLGLNASWTLCIAGPPACQWKATSGSIVIQLNYASGPDTWTAKISVDGGAHWAYFVLSGTLFDCTVDNTLAFDHADAGFVCGGIPATVTLHHTATCCDDSLAPGTCCCSAYPDVLHGTFQNVTGCPEFNGLTFTLLKTYPGCTDPSFFTGVFAFTKGGVDYCGVVQIKCSCFPCQMVINQFTLCQGTFADCSGATFCARPGFGFCDEDPNGYILLPAAIPETTGICDSDVSCQCNPVFFEFDSITLGLGDAPCDPGCTGTYNLMITA
jgi:hypothetical protein